MSCCFYVVKVAMLSTVVKLSEKLPQNTLFAKMCSSFTKFFMLYIITALFFTGMCSSQKLVPCCKAVGSTFVG